MTETLMRHLQMLRLMPRRGKIDTATLKRKLDALGFRVTQRTIQRDLKTLSARFPLICDEGRKPAGWWWAGNKVMDIPGMDGPTALSFSLCAKFLEPLMPRAALAHLEPHFRHAERTLAESHLGRWQRKVRIVPRGLRLLPADIAEGVTDTVYEALLSERQFSVRYRPREEAERVYRVNPLGLVFRDCVIYLVCTLFDYEDANDIVHLALHRMRAARLLDAARLAPHGFSLDAYVATQAFSYPEKGPRIRLRAVFDRGAAFHLHETPLSDDQRLSVIEDGRVMLKATVPETSELRWWLLGFGDGVEVIAPKRLRTEFRLIARNLAAVYG